MGKKKRNDEKDTLYAVYGRIGENDTYGYLYSSLLKSSAFQNLSIGARLFYVTLRVHAKTSECRRCLSEHAKEENEFYPNQYFVFPASHEAYYGYKRQNCTKYFKELKEAGFIRVVEQNKHRQKVNVYSFHNAWKDNSS